MSSAKLTRRRHRKPDRHQTQLFKVPTYRTATTVPTPKYYHWNGNKCIMRHNNKQLGSIENTAGTLAYVTYRTTQTRYHIHNESYAISKDILQDLKAKSVSWVILKITDTGETLHASVEQYLAGETCTNKEEPYEEQCLMPETNFTQLTEKALGL